MIENGNIIIYGKQGIYKDDKILLFTPKGQYHYYGVIDTIIKAYNNTEIIYETNSDVDEENLQNKLNFQVRGDILQSASSIILASKGICVPVSSSVYKEYDEKYNFFNCKYKYIIEILEKYDRSGDVVWWITLSVLKDATRFEPITRTIKEWDIWNKANVTLMPLLVSGRFELYNYDPKDVSEDIAESIHFNEIDLDILKNIYKDIGPCPCDKCLVKRPCNQISISGKNQKIRTIGKKCKQKSDYENVCLEYFLSKLGYDSALQELLRIAFKPD